MVKKSLLILHNLAKSINIMLNETKKKQPEGEEWGYRCEALVVGGGVWGLDEGVNT